MYISSDTTSAFKAISTLNFYIYPGNATNQEELWRSASRFSLEINIACRNLPANKNGKSTLISAGYRCHPVVSLGNGDIRCDLINDTKCLNIENFPSRLS